jgi:hypothetical protein
LFLSRAVLAAVIAANGMDSLSVKNLTPISEDREGQEQCRFSSVEESTGTSSCGAER